jgi:hypothetical protein
MPFELAVSVTEVAVMVALQSAFNDDSAGGV